MQRGWWFEDAVAGATLVHPGGRTIGRDEHPLLALMTDNGSPVHTDAHRAGGTPFGEPLVLGALSVAIVVGLAAPAVGPPEMAARALPTGWRRIHLTRAVVAGDTLRAASTIRSAVPDVDGAGGIVDREIMGLDQRGATVVVMEDRSWAPLRQGS
jgi:acyl dehydratase